MANIAATKAGEDRREALLGILAAHARSGAPLPSWRAVGAQLGCSAPTVSRHLKGLIRARQVQVIDRSDRSLQIKVVGVGSTGSIR